MNIWALMSYAAWIASAILLLWMFLDFLKVNKDFEEDFLLSSREGHDEIAEQERMWADKRASESKKEE